MNPAASRKRKKNAPLSSSNAQVELPRIPHVPTELIPQFLQTLQVTTKFFSKRPSDAFTIRDWEKENEGSSGASINPSNANTSNTSESNEDVHGSLMDRMHSATAAADQAATVAANEASERQASMKRAVHRWMEDVKRFARRKQQAATEESTTLGNPNATEVKERPSVPYAFFLYLWGMQQIHNRVAVRRSALFLSSLLLQKSKDCRQHLELDSQLSDWVSNIVGKGVLWKNPDRASKELPLLHREAFATLSFLQSNGYAVMYPKIGVAAKSLRHQCPNLEATDVSTSSSMPEYRRLRDVALRYGQEETRRVSKLVNKADACLEILVPRVGVTETAVVESSHKDSTEATTGDQNNTNDTAQTKDDSSDDESDIDWEDGDAPEDIPLPGSHRSAVDQTIAAMEASGATMLRGGELEIDFDVPQEEVLDSQSATDESRNLEARKKLEKYTRQLSERHLNRLTLWLDGLRSADNLTKKTKSASLVTLSSETSRLRVSLIQELTESKEQVSRVLSSASRLNIAVKEQNANAPSIERRQQHRSLGLGGDNGSRLSTILRQQKRKSNTSRST